MEQIIIFSKLAIKERNCSEMGQLEHPADDATVTSVTSAQAIHSIVQQWHYLVFAPSLFKTRQGLKVLNYSDVLSWMTYKCLQDFVLLMQVMLPVEVTRYYCRRQCTTTPQKHLLRLTAKSPEHKTANSRETRDFKTQELWSQHPLSLKNEWSLKRSRGIN